jgi:hypothetical protein
MWSLSVTGATRRTFLSKTSREAKPGSPTPTKENRSRQSTAARSAKWVRGLRLVAEDEPGFWESLGYHNHGDPWREQRYWGD